MFSLIRKLFRNDGIAGIFFLVLSYLTFFLPRAEVNRFTAIVTAAAFYLGIIFLANYITGKFAGFPIVSRWHQNRKDWANFVVLSLLFGLFMGIVGSDLAGFWYFPYWSVVDYVFIGFVLGGWTFYLMSAGAAYEATKVLLDHYFPESVKVRRYYAFEPFLYRGMKYVGVIAMAVPITVAFYVTRFFTEFHLTESVAKAPAFPWYYAALATLGLFLFCESVEYGKRRSSLLKDTFHGYFNPLISLIVAGLVVGIFNEIQNFDVFLWRYANYPLPGMMIFGVPIAVLIGWSVHILVFVSFWRAFGTRDTKIFFENQSALSNGVKVTSKNS